MDTLRLNILEIFKEIGIQLYGRYDYMYSDFPDDRGCRGNLLFYIERHIKKLKRHKDYNLVMAYVLGNTTEK